MDNYEDCVRPGTGSIGRRSFPDPIVGALVGTSAGGSSDILNAYDVGNPANWTTIPASSLADIIGFRTIGVNVTGLGAGEQLMIEFSGINQFFKPVGSTLVVSDSLPCGVTKYAYMGKPTVRVTAITEITSGAAMKLCSVGFGSPVPFETAPDGTTGQIVVFDQSSETGGPPAVATVTYDTTYHSFVPGSAPAVGDKYIVYGWTNCSIEPQGSTETVTAVASF